MTGKDVKVGGRTDLNESWTQHILADVSRGSQMCSEPTASTWEVCLYLVSLFCFSSRGFFVSFSSVPTKLPRYV